MDVGRASPGVCLDKHRGRECWQSSTFSWRHYLLVNNITEKNGDIKQNKTKPSIKMKIFCKLGRAPKMKHYTKELLGSHLPLRRSKPSCPDSILTSAESSTPSEALSSNTGQSANGSHSHPPGLEGHCSFSFLCLCSKKQKHVRP